MRGELLKGHLDLLILAALESGPCHGYAVIEALSEQSGGVFQLPEGTVYPVLHRLEKQGLLSSRWSQTSGRRRRTYRLTRSGKAALGSQRRDWSIFSQAVAAVVGARS